MVEIWRPSEDHLRYLEDPSFLELRFGVRLLSEILADIGVVAVSRFVVMPAFSGESIHTFTYRAREVLIESVRAEHSLWYSLSKGGWSRPSGKVHSLPLSDLPYPLSQWQRLRKVASSAPTVKEAIFEGRAYVTCDGVGYRHRFLDADTELCAQWNNPTPEASNHDSQVILVNAYNDALLMCGESAVV